MRSINTVTITPARLTRDAEISYTAGGVAVLKMSIAFNQRVKNGDKWESKPHFFDVQAWRHTAECNSSLSKGQAVCVSGQLQQQRWEKEGKKYSRVVILADFISALQEPSREERQETPEETKETTSTGPELDEDNLPF